MLKSLFESSIERLNIPSEMKTAIKQINNICLEAEGLEQDNDLGYTPMGEEDKKKVEKYKAEQADQNTDNKQNENTDVDKAKDNDEIYTILHNLQKKAVKNRGTEEGEKWRKKLEEEYSKATNNHNMKRVKGFELTIYNKGNQQTQTNDVKNDVSQSQTNEETTEKNNTSNENKQSTSNKYRADVATVQYYLQSINPKNNVVADGILGPKTITAIQENANIKSNGKMDKSTQDAFNHLLSEAKTKVKPIQEKLGVTADGLIGKKTLTAMKKENLQVASIFSANNTADTQNNKPITSSPFNENEANSLLKYNYITQKEFNIWQKYNISPYLQKTRPDETKAYIANAQKKRSKQVANSDNTNPAQQGKKTQVAKQETTQQSKQGKMNQVDTQGSSESKKNGVKTTYYSGSGVPQNDAEKKFFEQAYNKYLKQYMAKAKGNGTREQLAMDKADLEARNELVKYRMKQQAKQNS
jgi:hypothetical protein